MKRAILTVLLFQLLVNLSFSYSINSELIQTNSSGDFDARVKKGIDYIYNIQFDSAEVVFKKLMLDYPESPAGRFFLAMIDWWKIAIDPENESLDNLFFEKLEDVIYHCDQILKKD